MVFRLSYDWQDGERLQDTEGPPAKMSTCQGCQDWESSFFGLRNAQNDLYWNGTISDNTRVVPSPTLFDVSPEEVRAKEQGGCV